MSSRVSRIVLSVVVGMVAVALGLYSGRFIALGVGLVFASSLQALALATSVTWWGFIGLINGVGLGFGALRRGRLRFILMSVLGFALGGVIAAVPGMNRMDRASAIAVLATPVGGALAGLLIGLSVRLKAGVVLMVIAGALAMWIAQPFFELLPPRSILDALLTALVGSGSSTPASSDAGTVALNTLLLLAPGALIGAALSAWMPDHA